MRALRIHNRRLTLDDISKPPPNGEALVRVLKSGICGTDLELVKGYSGFAGTPGHEFVGVAETAPGRPELVGKRVVGEINVGCGYCELCKLGDPRHCPTRTVLGIVGRDGAHAEFLKLPAQNLHLVPDTITDEDAVFVEPLAAAAGIRDCVDLNNCEDVAVIGDGKLGILCTWALRTAAKDKKIILIGKHEEKLKIASISGVETVKTGDASKLSRRFDVAVEASGSESGFATALEIIRPRGTIVMKSTYHGFAQWDASRVVVDEIRVVGSRCGRFAPALELLASNQIPVADLITEEFPLSDGVSAFDRAGTKGVLKVLLRAA